jgi:uncharacterized OB-fold protein
MPVPYAVGIADFSPETRVFGRLLGWEGGVQIGQEVVAAVAPVEETRGLPEADFRLRLTASKGVQR